MAVLERPPIINGVEYTHADITLNLFGIPIVGLTSISYGAVQQISPNYSTGHLPTSVGFGQVDLTATLTITSVEFRKLLLRAPLGRIQNIRFFDIGVNYIPENGFFVRDRLIRCKFKGPNLNSTTNNTQIEVPLELFVADILYNV